jgi:hypothetical protein
VGLPYGPIDFLFGWADVGTPVVVIPGAGTPAQQMASRAYNDPQTWAAFGSP